MGIAHVAERNLRVVNLIDLAEQTLVALIDDIKFVTSAFVPVVSEPPLLQAFYT